MSVGTGFRRLTRVIRTLERAGWTIDTVDGVDDATVLSEQQISAIITATRPREHDGPSLSDVLADTTQADVRTLELVPVGDINRARLRVRIQCETEQRDPVPSTSSPARPLHRDGPRLRSLYETHSSFGEMAEAIEENVSGETIRRYMIEHGIHHPGAAVPGTREQPMLADGYGRAVSDDIPTLIEVLTDSNTIYDIQRRLDLDREHVVELLDRFDLLDVVVGRLNSVSDRETRRELIEQRLDPENAR